MLGVNYPGLSDMFYDGPNVFKTAEGYRRSDEASANNAQNLADAIQAHQFDQQMNPLRVQGKQQELDKGALEYELAKAKQPGLLSQAQNMPFDDKGLSAMMSHFEGLGQTAVARGGLSPLDPLAIQLKRSGFPQEVLDQLSTKEGAQAVLDAGKSFRENSQKYQLQGLKNAGAVDVAGIRADMQRELEAGRNARAAAANALRERLAQAHNAILKDSKQAKDPATWQARAIQLEKLSNDPSLSPEERAIYLEQANRAVRMQMEAIDRAAAARAAGTPDLGSIGIQTNQPPEKPVLAPVAPSPIRTTPTTRTAPAPQVADPYAGFKIK
jgi:hypothetical protein